MSTLPLVRMSLLNRILLVSLVLGAVLIGSLALHSATGARGMEALSSTIQPHANDESAHHTAAAAGGANVQSGAITQDITCDAQCALVAMVCVLLLVLTAVTILARHPGIRRRLVGSSWRSIDAIGAARQHIDRPSLTVLSISRT